MAETTCNGAEYRTTGTVEELLNLWNDPEAVELPEWVSNGLGGDFYLFDVEATSGPWVRITAGVDPTGVVSDPVEFHLSRSTVTRWGHTI